MDAINATGRAGQAALIQRVLANKGFTPGMASSGTRRRTRSVIYYPPASSAAAAAAAALLGGLTVEPDSSVEVGHLQVVLGSQFTMPVIQPAPPTSASDSAPVDGNATHNGTDITLNSSSGEGIPCVP